MTPEGPQVIAEALKANAFAKGAMTSLDISNNNLGELVLPEGWTKKSKHNHGMVPWVYEHTDGTKQENHPGKPEGVIAIADAITAMGALTLLNVSNNQLCGLDEYRRGTYDASGVTALADAIEKHE